MISSIFAIIDAMVEDLTTTGGLTPKTVKKYAEPTIVNPTPAVLPILAVWSEKSELKMISTFPDYAIQHTYQTQIEWFISGPKTLATGGTGDTQYVQELWNIEAAIMNRIKAWGPGFPVFDATINILPTSSQIMPTEGSIFKLAVELEVIEIG